MFAVGANWRWGLREATDTYNLLWIQVHTSVCLLAGVRFLLVHFLRRSGVTVASLSSDFNGFMCSITNIAVRDALQFLCPTPTFTLIAG